MVPFAIYHPLDQWISLRRTSPSSSPSSLPRMTNNKHRHFSLSNGVFTDKKFTRLPPFARGTGRLASSSSRPPAGSHPIRPTLLAHPDDAVPFSRGYLHADTFGLLRCLVESGPLAVCTAVQTDRYKRGGRVMGSLPSRLARLRHDFSDASRVGGGLRSFFLLSSFVERCTERDEFIGCTLF